MATTDVQYGGQRRLAGALTASPANDSGFGLLENDTSFTVSLTRDETKHSVKGSANKISVTHKKDMSIKCDGELVLTDPVYLKLVAAHLAGTPIEMQGRQPYAGVVKVAWEGKFNVVNLEETNAENDVAKVTMTLTPAEEITFTEGGRALVPA